MALDPNRFLLLAHRNFLKDLQVGGLLDADDEIHTFFSEVVEGFVVAAEVPVADLDAWVARVLRRGFAGTDV